VSRSCTLDLGRWTTLWTGLGGRGDGLAVFTRLATAYAEPARAYHTAEHIQDCLEQFDLIRKTARHPHEVEAALWFHDAIYQPARSDNEERSAELARTVLAESAVPPAVVHRIAELVRISSHDTSPSEPDAALLCDIDLSILGRSPAVFNRFERLIRREYAWVPEFTYRSARSEVLGEFLRRPSIYLTPYFRKRYEGPARANLARLLKRLGS